MSHEIDDIPRFDDPLLEREWLLQEHAMRRERLHLDPAGDDARSQRYRALARALRTASPHALPADFAQQVSALADASSPRQVPAMRFENVLATVLGGVFLLAAVVATIIYGAAWWPSFKTLLPAPAAAQWWLTLLGCVGLSWLLGACSRRAGSAD
jgi:type IV secretory pathway VirB2 component (pilin)